MKIVKEKLPNGNTITYQELESGTCYHVETPEPIIKRLEDARINRYRLRLFFGDTKTGQDWNEENDVTGYVGRSTGTIKIPLLIHNGRSMGGGAILDHCIIKIMVRGCRVYEHPKYHSLPFSKSGSTVLRGGEVTAVFDTPRKAEKYIAFMKGERHTKGGV